MLVGLILHEASQGKESRFHAWLSSFPSEFSDFSNFNEEERKEVSRRCLSLFEAQDRHGQYE